MFVIVFLLYRFLESALILPYSSNCWFLQSPPPLNQRAFGFKREAAKAAESQTPALEQQKQKKRVRVNSLGNGLCVLLEAEG